jgi:hypothetical protein
MTLLIAVVEVTVTSPLTRKYCAIGPTDMALIPAHEDACRLFNIEQMLTA